MATSLSTLLFSHPGNADPSFEEYFTPCKEDEFFGASLDGFSAFRDVNRDLLAFANPEYEPVAMNLLFETIGRRILASKRACRIVVIVPFGEGQENCCGMDRGIALAQIPGAIFSKLFVIQPKGFHFWDASFWRDPAKWKVLNEGADFRVGILMFENQEACDKYPIEWEAFIPCYDMLKTMAHGGMLEMDSRIQNAVRRRIKSGPGAEVPLAELVKMDDEVLDIIERRLQERCGFEKGYTAYCRVAVQYGIVDAKTQEEIGTELGGLRGSYVRIIQGRIAAEKKARMREPAPQQVAPRSVLELMKAVAAKRVKKGVG